jgi:hemolysin activation/secretion protein
MTKKSRLKASNFMFLASAPPTLGHYRSPAPTFLAKRVLPLALLALSQGAYAQQPPTAGSQLQQIPVVPQVQNTTPEMRIERGTAPATPGVEEKTILVRSLVITGAKVFSEAELVAITGFKPGSELTLTELKAMASRITTH